MLRSGFVLISAIFLLCRTESTLAQRVYADRSVLADGNWYKLAVKAAGIYKIDIPQLNAMGISTASLPSSHIRLFGNGGAMLPEDNAAPRADDLPEIAISVMDGGDGLLNGNDYILFYAPGPHTWQKDAQGYRHTYNLYTDSACYFLNISPGGLRVQPAPAVPNPNFNVSAFDFRVFQEDELHNILSSGKQWLGDEFGNGNGSTAERTYTINLPPGGLTDVFVRFQAVSRSTGSSRFDVLVNNVLAESFYPAPVSGNIFEEYASPAGGWFPAQGGGTLTLRYQGNASAQGWLDFLEVQGRAALRMPAQGALLFRDASGTGPGRIGRFSIDNAAAQTQVWDVTDPGRPRSLPSTFSGGSLQFNADCAILKEFAAFTPETLPQPEYIGPVPNQDLHGASTPDMLIITATVLENAAARLAAWHNAAQQLQVSVVTVDQIYNEFASGSPDPTALRDFVKMHYDRGGLRYLLLFGRASYDYRDRLPGNTNIVPTWQSSSSWHGITAYMSDDYFGFLDDGDNIGNNGQINLLDVAIGRLPVKNAAEADAVVDKIAGYHAPRSFGPWRNEMTFVADDEDNNLHLEDAETVSRIIETEQPVYNVDKIYLDAFPQVSSSGGSRYPAANEAITNRINSGTLVWNYTGHGGFSRLAEEAILEEAALPAWKNADRLPLMVTATCDFAPFDNPAFQSLGEKLVLMPEGGAIALMTTTRAVFAASNLVMNANYFRLAFQPGTPLGEGARLAKNETYAALGDVINNRKFQLLGDPALLPAFPLWRVYTDSINGQPLSGADTLKALGKYTIQGSVRDADGMIKQDYNGVMTTTVYDKPAGSSTLGNDPGSAAVVYRQQDRILFKGTQQVRNGRFSFTFVVPRDILQEDGHGKISYYTQNETSDGTGVYGQLPVNGTAAAPADNEGPQIQAWMNDESFRDGGLVNEEPLLLVRLYDDNGINATGNGIGHDIVAILDDSTRFFNLNAWFEARRDDYRQGDIRFPMAGLAPGEHTLTIRAWDTHNNSSTIRIRFKVVLKATLAVENVFNYPNPFRDQTRFVFTHNQQGTDLDVVIRIFTPAGQLVRTMSSTINSVNGRYDGVPWNGTADSGARLTPGIYFYQIVVKDEMSKEKVFGGKMILL